MNIHWTLVVGGDAEGGFEVADDENQSDEQGRNGQSFQGDAFHFNHLCLKMAQTSAKRSLCVGE